MGDEGGVAADVGDLEGDLVGAAVGVGVEGAGGAGGFPGGLAGRDGGGVGGGGAGGEADDRGGAVAEVPGIGGVDGLGGPGGGEAGAAVEGDVGLHAVEAEDVPGAGAGGDGELGFEPDPGDTGDAGVGQFERGAAEGGVEVVVLSAEGLVVEGAGFGEFVGRDRASEDRLEVVAALVGGLVLGFVLPAVEEGVGDEVLLLDGDLADDDVGEAGVVGAVGAEADLVGLLRVGAFELFPSFGGELFFGGLLVEGFLFGGVAFLGLLLCARGGLAGGIEGAILAGVGERAVGEGEVVVPGAAGAPGDDGVEDGVGVAADGVGGADGGVVAAEAVGVNGGERAAVGAVDAGPIQADGDAGGRGGRRSSSCPSGGHAGR